MTHLGLFVYYCMKCILFLLLLLCVFGHGQTQHTPNIDSALLELQNKLSTAQEQNDKNGEIAALEALMAFNYSHDRLGEFIDQGIRLLNLYIENKNYEGQCNTLLQLQGSYRDEVSDSRKSLHYSLMGERISREHNIRNTIVFPNHRAETLFLAEIAGTYLQMGIVDSAEFYVKKAIAQNELFNGSSWNFPIFLLGRIYEKQGKYSESLSQYRKALPLAFANDLQHQHDTLQIYSGMSTHFSKTGRLDSAIHYAQLVVHSTNPDQEAKHKLESLENLAFAYSKLGPKDSSHQYRVDYYILKDSLYNIHRDREIQAISFNQALREEELKTERSRIQMAALLAGLVMVLIISFLLWRNNRREHLAKEKIEKAFGELKATQAQLIHSEKMASLGELTAGVAHEIQNPLNFVNNFSELNTELIIDLQKEARQGNLAQVQSIAEMLAGNEEKINQHGKKADAIVKAMLQHSRGSNGLKETVNINTLCENAISLAYHGMKVKDKTFQVRIETDLDPSIPAIDIVPQDISRVLINLLNNAFYATQSIKAGTYESLVKISTRRVDEKIKVTVEDNGPGIPTQHLGKVFQPFFTTKPTGQGTGLGLSLSYDIIKANGGELKVENHPNAGCIFTFII
jgi:two-component system, NtrC family, sensor kinase